MLKTNQKITISKKKYGQMVAAQAVLEVQREIWQGKVQTHFSAKSLFDDLDNSENTSL